MIDLEKITRESQAIEGYDREQAIRDWQSYSPPIAAYYGGTLLGTFYPDNTFEFNGKYLGQGDMTLLSSMLPGWVCTKVQYGGVMFTHRQSRVVHPVYKGMRIRLCDGKPIKDYEVHVNLLDRKLTAPIRKEYEKFFKVAEAMLKAMGDEAIYKEIKAIHQGEVPLRSNENGSPIHPRYIDVLKVIDHNDPAGSVLSLMLRYDWAQILYSISWHNDYAYKKFCVHSRGGENLVKSVKEHFFKEVYKDQMRAGVHLMQTQVFKTGEKMATCYWGHKMLVDGVEVERIR